MPIEDVLKPDSLVAYKKRPGRVIQTGERVLVELEGGVTASVRPKDILLLHPGPLDQLNVLTPQQGEAELAWQMLREYPDEIHDLPELAELIFGQFTPATAWATWQLIEEDLYFYGTPQEVHVRTEEDVTRKSSARQARASESQAWAEFIERARHGQIQIDKDRKYLQEVEDLALERRKDNRLLRALGRSERPENAHALLLDCKFWDYTFNPYPIRLGLLTAAPEIILNDLPEENRLDLTGLPAFAIDDENNTDPDDAISLESCQRDSTGRLISGRLWVHVADVAAVVLPESAADLEARSRGATLYIPEGPIPMLPPEAVARLGLGLKKTSPALSFGFELNMAGETSGVQITPSRVSVQRLTYEQVEEQIHEFPFQELDELALAYQRRRQENGAMSIDLPEAQIYSVEGKVIMRPVLRLRSRDMVRETMIMAGETAARLAAQHSIPFPFATQESSDLEKLPKSVKSNNSSTDDLARSFALRKVMKRSKVSGQPAPHAGVGLPVYSRVTSPLRRYLDLVAHQQLRAFVSDQPLLSEQEILERVGATEAVMNTLTWAESLARRHWTMVFLLQNPSWQGESILVEKNGPRGRVIIPELALETSVQIRGDMPLNSSVPLIIKSVDLAELEASFLTI